MKPISLLFSLGLPYALLLFPISMKIGARFGNSGMRRYTMTQIAYFAKNSLFILLPSSLVLFFTSGFEYWYGYILAYIATGAYTLITSNAHTRVLDTSVDQWTQPYNFSCDSCGHPFWEIADTIGNIAKPDIYLIKCLKCNYAKEYSEEEYNALYSGWTNQD